MHVGQIASGAPTLVYALLAGLIFLGVRRLRTREVPVAVALLPSIAFFLWSVIGVSAFAHHVGILSALGAWGIGAALGAASGALLPDHVPIRAGSDWPADASANRGRRCR